MWRRKMIRIVIVDDHILFREGLQVIINQEPDFEIVGLAGTVLDATQQVLALKPDIVLMDLTLPDGNSTEAISQILVERPEIKIISLYLSETKDDLLEVARSGASGFISKNIPTLSLIDSIRAIYRMGSVLSDCLPLSVMREMVSG